jgi:hypothetical protein
MRRFGRRAVLEHNGNAILDRIVAPTATAMQPLMRSIVWTSRDGRMAYRANKDLEQNLGENGVRHSTSLERFPGTARENGHLP